MLGEQTESRSEDPNGKEWSERMMQERRQVGCNTSSFISFFCKLDIYSVCCIKNINKETIQLN